MPESEATTSTVAPNGNPFCAQASPSPVRERVVVKEERRGRSPRAARRRDDRERGGRGDARGPRRGRDPVPEDRWVPRSAVGEEARGGARRSHEREDPVAVKSGEPAKRSRSPDDRWDPEEDKR